MPGSIIVNKKESPMNDLMMLLLLNKIKHKQEMDIVDRKLKVEQLLTEEERTYNKQSKVEGEERAEVSEYRNKGWRLPEEVPDKETRMRGKVKRIGGRLMFYPEKPQTPAGHEAVWNKNEWDIKKTETDQTGDIRNYKQAVSQGYRGDFNTWFTDIKKAGAPQLSFGEQQQQKNLAYFKSPQFNFDVKNQTLKKFSKFDWEDLPQADKRQHEIETADAAIRQAVPGAKYGYDEKKKQYGWFNQGEMIAPWSFDK